MPVQLLSFATPYTLQTNMVYALPAGHCTVFCADASPALEQSALFDFSTKASVSVTAGKTDVAGLFLRCTSGNPVIVLNRE
jgi:hypothetical protein